MGNKAWPHDGKKLSLRRRFKRFIREPAGPLWFLFVILVIIATTFVAIKIAG